MLTALRNFAKSWVAAILMGLLAISFIGWGAQKYDLNPVRGDQVVKAGSRVVDSAEFSRNWDLAKKQIEQRSGQPVTPEAAAANHLDALVLKQVAIRAAFTEMLRRMGIVPSDKQVAAEIQKIPVFFDQVSGRFDKRTFVARLAENNLTPAAFDREIREDTAGRQFLIGIANGMQAPKAYGAAAAVGLMETRDLAYFTLTPQLVGIPAPPTDAQLTAFMTQHAAQLTRPEMRVLTLVRFTPNPAAATGPIDPAELKKRYDFKKDTFSKPEVRTIVQIPAKSAAAAQAISAALAKGDAPEAVAKAQGAPVNTFRDKPQSAIPDRKAAAAAFQAQAGQVRTVQGDLGLQVVKVLSITPGHEVSLEEARPELEAEIRADMAKEKAYAQSQAFDDATQAGASLAQAAQKAGVPTVTVGPVTQKGQDGLGRPVQGVEPQVLEAAFGLPPGGESEITEGEGGAYFAVKVEKIVPPSLPPLAEVRGELTRFWLQQQMIQRLQARAKELSDRLAKGEKLEAVAASAGAPLSRAPGLSRRTADQNQTVPQEALMRVFAIQPGETFAAPTRAFTVVVGKVENARMDPSPEAAQLALAQREGMTSALAGEMAQQAQMAAQTQLKVRVDKARARSIAGLPPEEETAAAGKKK